MSSSDQQYPYGQQYGYGDARPPQPPAQAADQPPPYDQQQPYANGPGPYGDQQPHGRQSHGGQGHSGPPSGGQASGQEPSGGRPYAQQQQSYGNQAPYDPYGAGTYAPDPAAAAGAGRPAHQPQQQPMTPVPEQGQHVDQGATQTWQGQTWDTQYQPTIQPAQGQAAQPARPQPVQPGFPAAADTAYPQPLSASGAYPLPPEAPATSVAPASAAVPAPAGTPGAAGYSSPTTVGNSRITDAQRARAEGRSPVIAPGMQPAAITAGLGLLLALGAAVGPYALLVPLVLLQAVTAAGWFRLNGMWPARQGIVLAFAGGVVADAVLLAAGRENAAAAVLGTLGIWVLLTLVLQLRSHAGADERMQGLMATVASASLAVLAAGHLAAIPDAVTVGGVAVAAAVLARALPLPGAVSVVVALLVAAGTGLAVGSFTDFGAQSAYLGLAAGGCALIGLRVASYDYPSKFVHMTAGVALPLTAAAPAVYLIGRAIA